MNTIKIYYDEGDGVAELKKDFRLYQGQYQSKLLNVYVPTSKLAPAFAEHELDPNEDLPINERIGATIGEYLATTSVKVGITHVDRAGKIKVSKNYYMRYVKTLTYQGVEYALYERKLPKEFTMYAGQGQNAPELITNVVNIQSAEYAEATDVTAETAGTYYVKELVPDTTLYVYKAKTLPTDYVEGTTYYTQTQPETVLDITTTETCALDVMPSKDLTDTETVDPSEIDVINGEINEIYEILPTKQDKTDATINLTTNASQEVTWQNSQTVVGAINNNTAQNETNRVNIGTNTADISAIDNRVAALEASWLSYETYIGQTSGASLPTQTQLTNFVETSVAREPKLGDVVIFILEITGATDKNYKYYYTETGWQGYEIPAMESASNGSLGLVKGTYALDATANTLVDISGGAILNIYIKDATNTYRNLVEYLNTSSGQISNVIDGTTAVAKALRAVSDELGNDIVDTYMTKQYGATKQYVKDYAMPKEFNEINYISADGYVSEPPTEPANGIQFTTNTSAVGNFQIFQLTKENDAEFTLSNKNGYADTIYMSASSACDVYFRMTTQYKKVGGDWTTMAIELTPLVQFPANEVVKVEFESLFTSLGENVVDMVEGDQIRQTLEVVTETSTALTFNLYSNATYPSRFYFESIIYVIKPVSVDDVQFTYQSTDGSGNNIYQATTTLTDGNTINSGNITSPRGPQGKNVSNVQFTYQSTDASGNNIYQATTTLDDNTAINSGTITSPHGKDVTNVQVEYVSTQPNGDNVYNVVTTLSDNTAISSGTITCPKGPTGAFAAVDTALSDTSVNPVQNKVITVPLTAIQNKIPDAATAQNQLADKQYVLDNLNSIAAYYITYNANGDAFPTKAALTGASTFYSGGVTRIPTHNDYCLVLADESQGTTVSGYTLFTTTTEYVGYFVIYNNAEVEVTTANKDSVGIVPGTTVAYETLPTTRYIYSGAAGQGQWDFQFVVNETPFTTAQLAAINSGITSVLTAQIPNKMDKANPTGTGAFSLNRLAGSTVGVNSVAEGSNCTASGTGAHAEGEDTIASGNYSHAEGISVLSDGAVGDYSHTEGVDTEASGTGAHAEGSATMASGDCSHVEGQSTVASGGASHAEGIGTTAQRRSQHTFGEFNVLDASGTATTRGTYIEIVGNGTDDNARSNARTLDWSGNEVLSGTLTTSGLKNPSSTSYTLSVPTLTADGTIATTADVNNKMDKSNPTGTGALSLNRLANSTIGTNSVAVGESATASGNRSFAEGFGTIASGSDAHAEGSNTTASGGSAHAEGSSFTVASGSSSHAEGYGTTASGNCSHSEGEATVASGGASHAEGVGTTAQRKSQHTFGEYNILDTNGTTTTHGTYIEIVGNGTAPTLRSNARTLDWSGNEVLAGTITINGTGTISYNPTTNTFTI